MWLDHANDTRSKGLRYGWLCISHGLSEVLSAEFQAGLSYMESRNLLSKGIVNNLNWEASMPV